MEKRFDSAFGGEGFSWRELAVCRWASTAVRAFRESVASEFRRAKQVWGLRHELRKVSGQGTTEYAILVGVLVVIAILAITVFRPKIQELWDAISSGINGL